MPTPNRGYVYPATSSPATVPADLRVPLEQVDADVQTLVDEAAAMVGLNTDGTAPPALEAQVRALISTEAPPPDLSPYPTRNEVEDGLQAATEPLASKTELAEGLAEVKPTPEAVALAAGHVLHIGATPPASDTMYGVPVVWIDTRNRSAWNPAVPLFDLTRRTVTIPTDEGATYYRDGALVSAGTYSVAVPEGGATVVTVSAVPVAGYTFAEGSAAGWQVTYEDGASAYDVAALAGHTPEYYYRLDDAFPAKPRNRGTGTLEQFWDPRNATVGPDIGVGATSMVDSFRFFIRPFWDRPITALTAAAVVQASDPGASHEGVQIVTGPRGAFLLRTAHLEGAHRIEWGPLDGSPVRRVDSPAAAGAIVHLATVWDGETQTVYVDGVQVDSLEVTEIAAAAPDGRATLAGGQTNTPIAGLVLDTVARDSAWVEALSASVRR